MHSLGKVWFFDNLCWKTREKRIVFPIYKGFVLKNNKKTWNRTEKKVSKQNKKDERVTD